MGRIKLTLLGVVLVPVDVEVELPDAREAADAGQVHSAAAAGGGHLVIGAAAPPIPFYKTKLFR